MGGCGNTRRGVGLGNKGPRKFGGSDPFGKITLPSQRELCMYIFICFGDHHYPPPKMRMLNIFWVTFFPGND